jgi:hypothetical protein
MEAQNNHTTQFRYNAKQYHALVKVNVYVNGYSIAKVIIDQEQYWALHNGVSWQLMVDTRKSNHFGGLILKYLKTVTKAFSTSTKN